MEENRQMAEKRAKADEVRRHQIRLQNLEALKEQIKAHENAKLMETQRIEEECIRLNQANIRMQLEEAHKLKDKQERQRKLKEILDQGTAQLLYSKQLQNEEERVIELRIANFMKQKQEREEKNKAEAEAIKAAKLKGIDLIAKSQKAEQELKEELEKIRTIKIQEDVEREYRRKERDAAIKKNREIKQLLEDRTKQIKEIHRQIAREIAKDEQSFNDAARQNEEFIRKEKLLEEKHKQQVERHRQEIMKQINDKELARAELRAKSRNEGIAMRMEQEQKEKYEKTVIRQKVGKMREQGIPEAYVQEVEQCLARHGYK
ncbi:hypothetical protein EVAR_54402_1 [Eumeta japonica]|uniref:Cilia- and flagella-associated protein 45 n=1 Tax=Eumeta variegata TaxID=151549 RepID=A0A4C1Y6Y9_EUMVA|nr:hypothetical protein EVAR_54402_1 [Eumeta japonica]